MITTMSRSGPSKFHSIFRRSSSIPTAERHAHVFDASTGFLTPTTLTSPNAQTNGEFGYSVAVNEGDPIVVVGAPVESGGGSPAGGHAYVFFFLTQQALGFLFSVPNTFVNSPWATFLVTWNCPVFGENH